jgi:RimJ/RimL family protein N-acetyltransferase
VDITIREAQPDDAAALIAYMVALAAEPDIDIPLQPGEFTHTEETERVLIKDVLTDPYRLMLVAVNARGALIGVLTLMGSPRQALRHAVELGISVRRDWRGRGVGTALMRRALDYARTGGAIKRIQLKVYARNTRAIALYERLGFVTEGRCRRAIFQDGEYLDNLVMALLLD